jgi:hypothetical protein
MTTAAWLRGKWPFLVLGHLLFLGLAVLAVVHWPLRIIHTDAAFQVFKWVHADGVDVEAHRYTAILPQLLVKAMRWLGLGYRGLLVAASLAHVLIPWATYALCAHVWRIWWLAAACALSAVLTTRLAFYVPVLEAHYLLSYPYLLAGMLLGPMLRRRDKGALAWSFVALVMLLLAHPAGALVALFTLVFCMLVEPRISGPAIMLTLVTVVWALLGRWVLPPSDYEQALYRSAWEGLRRLDELGSLPSFAFLVRHSWADSALYMPLWLLLVTTVTAMVVLRKRLVAALVLVGVPLFTLLHVALYHTGETAVMVEKAFLPLATLVALPALYAVLKAPRHPALVLAYALLLFTGLRTVSFASRPVGERHAALEQLVADIRAQDDRKVLLTGTDIADRGLGVSWALPFETLLLSALDGPDLALTALPDDLLPPGSDPQGVALPPLSDDLSPNALRNRFFRIPSGPYVYLRRSER